MPQGPSGPVPRESNGPIGALRRGVTRVSAVVRSFRWTVWSLAVAGAALAVLIVLVWAQYQAYLDFQSSSGDLGLYNQAFHSTLYSHLFFYSTVGLPAGTNGDIFAIHFVPFYLLLLPFYALAPTAVGLIIIKQVALVLAVLPLFALAKLRLKSEKWAALIAIAYLAAPITMSMDWASFDPEAFYPLTFFGMFYFLAKGKTLPLLVSWTIAISVEETATEILLVFVIACLVGNFLNRPSSTAVPLKVERRNLLLMTGIGLVWLGLSIYTLTVLNVNGGTFGQSYSARFGVLGATSIPGIPLTVLLHPANAWSALNYQGHEKWLYLLLVLACAGFLPLIGGFRYLVPLLGWLSLSFLSNSISFYSFGAESPGYVIPFIFVGMIGGIVAISKWTNSMGFPLRSIAGVPEISPAAPNPSPLLQAGASMGEVISSTEGRSQPRDGVPDSESRPKPSVPPSSPAEQGPSRLGPRLRNAGSQGESRTSVMDDKSTTWRRRFILWAEPSAVPSVLPREVQVAIVGLILISVGAAAFVASPLTSNPLGTVTYFDYGQTVVTSHDRLLSQVIDLIPSGSSILTTQHLFPALSNRPDAYVLPQQGFFSGNVSYQSIVDHIVNQSTYILVDYQADPYGAIYMQHFVNLTQNGFGILAAADGAYLFERGWNHGSELWEPFIVSYDPNQLSPRAARIDPSVSTSFGPALSYSANGTNHELLWTGPGFLMLPPGKYNATFMLDFSPTSPGNPIKLEATVTLSNVLATASLITSAGRHYEVGLSGRPLGTEFLGNRTIPYLQGPQAESIVFETTSVGRLNLPAYLESGTVSLYLYGITLTEVAPLT